MVDWWPRHTLNCIGHRRTGCPAYSAHEGDGMTTTESLEAEFSVAWANLESARQKMADLRRRMPPEPVKDYELKGPEGSVRLSEMFADKTDLILIHNMGSECPYCTMWADGPGDWEAKLDY